MSFVSFDAVPALLKAVPELSGSSHCASDWESNKKIKQRKIKEVCELGIAINVITAEPQENVILLLIIYVCMLLVKKNSSEYTATFEWKKDGLWVQTV